MRPGKTDMKKYCATVLAAALAVAGGSASGGVRSLSFGIDLNCPFGLEECWPQVFDRLVHLPGAMQMVENVGREDHETAMVLPAEGQFLSPGQVGRFVEDMRIGARLRGMEATIDGRVSKIDGRLLLFSPEFENGLPLEPLERKIQLDFRSKEPLAAQPHEREAHARLLGETKETPRWIRLVGPLGQEPKKGRLSLQVREFYWFGGAMTEAQVLTVGIRVNSPYGLTEPWAAVRSCLTRLPSVTWVATEPNVDGATVAVRVKSGQPVNTSQWNTALGRLGIGAELTGIEASLEGRIVTERSRLVMQLNDRKTIPLAPLSRSVRWDYRKKREILPTRVEREAYHQLHQTTGGQPRTVRVSGPLLQQSGGKAALLEIQQFRFTDGSEVAARDGGDYTAPDAPRTLRARFQPDGPLLLTWAPKRDPDFAGYHLYRSPKLTGPFKRLNPAPLHAPRLVIRNARSLVDHWYFVTAIDQAGNESPRSEPASAALPAPPSKVRIQSEADRAILEWAENRERDFENYNVYRSEKQDGPFGEIASVLYRNRYVNHGLRPGRTYHYVVTAVDTSDNESHFSKIVTVTIPSLSAQAKLR